MQPNQQLVPGTAQLLTALLPSPVPLPALLPFPTSCPQTKAKAELLNKAKAHLDKAAKVRSLGGLSEAVHRFQQIFIAIGCAELLRLSSLQGCEPNSWPKVVPLLLHFWADLHASLTPSSGSCEHVTSP